MGCVYEGKDNEYWNENTGRDQEKKKKDTEEPARIHYKIFTIKI